MSEKYDLENNKKEYVRCEACVELYEWPKVDYGLSA